MRVVMVSKALVVGAYQRKAEEMARLGIELVVLVPPRWQDRRGKQLAQPCYTQGYQFTVIPLVLNGNFHWHFYPTLGRELARLRPQIVHMDEEPYNLATWLGLRSARRIGALGIFFTWQNLYRRYPPPFAWWERATYQAAPHAIAGNQEAAGVLRRKGYIGELAVIPQFGVDPVLFSPQPKPERLITHPFQIGYAGGLLPEKGIDRLIRACAELRGAWQLHIVGDGAERSRLQALAASLAVSQQVMFAPRIESTRMPDFYRSLDVLVAPSRTLPNWKEQFGRVLIEAMACGVPVIGSNSGQIPHVIEEAGLIFQEDDLQGLRGHLQHLLDEPAVGRRLVEAGRQRVLEHFTMQRVAQQTVAVYQRMLDG
jgi:glycosyltransferase involved in cell wall biosynthesis